MGVLSMACNMSPPRKKLDSIFKTYVLRDVLVGRECTTGSTGVCDAKIYTDDADNSDSSGPRRRRPEMQFEWLASERESRKAGAASRAWKFGAGTTLARPVRNRLP